MSPATQKETVRESASSSKDIRPARKFVIIDKSKFEKFKSEQQIQEDNRCFQLSQTLSNTRASTKYKKIMALPGKVTNDMCEEIPTGQDKYSTEILNKKKKEQKLLLLKQAKLNKMKETSNWQTSMPTDSKAKISSKQTSQKISNGTSSRAKSRDKLIDIHIGTTDKRISTSHSRTTKS